MESVSSCIRDNTEVIADGLDDVMGGSVEQLDSARIADFVEICDDADYSALSDEAMEIIERATTQAYLEVVPRLIGAALTSAFSGDAVTDEDIAQYVQRW